MKTLRILAGIALAMALSGSFVFLAVVSALARLRELAAHDNVRAFVDRDV